MSQQSIEHGLLLPILFHCRDDNGRPILPSTTPELEREAWRDIRPAVSVRRKFWQPVRYPRSAIAELSRGVAVPITFRL